MQFGDVRILVFTDFGISGPDQRGGRRINFDILKCVNPSFPKFVNLKIRKSVNLHNLSYFRGIRSLS